MSITANHPILFDRLENQIAVLDRAYGVKITQRLQQEWTIEFYHPLDDAEKWTLIESECLVQVEGQQYVLKVVEPDDSSGGIRIHCQGDHISIQTVEEYIDPADDASLGRTSFLLGVDATTWLTNALKGTRFTLGTVNVTGLYDIDMSERNLQDVLREGETTWGGELSWNNRTVSFLTQIGQSNGVVLRYRKNNQSIKRTEDTRNLCTRIYGYGSGGMTIEAINPTKYLDASTISNYSHVFKLKKDYSNIDDPTALKAAMQKDLNDLSQPKVTYQLSIVDYANIAGYPYQQLESFGLGDYVTVIDERLNDLSIVSRVTEYEFYPYESLNLSTVQIQSLKDTTYDQIKNAHSGVTSLLQTVNISPRRNGRTLGTAGNPTAPAQSVSYTSNTDGSVNITVQWSFTEDATSPIDGFGILVHSATGNGSYTFPANVNADASHIVDKTVRGFTLFSVAADQFYTIAVYPFRNVDSDIASSMQIKGGNWYVNGGVPYQPSATVTYAGYVSGVPASTISNVANNFNGRNDRISDTPATPTGLTLSNALNTDGSADVVFSWTFSGSDNAHNIDGFFVYIYSSKTNAAYTFGATPSAERVFDVDSSKTSFVLYGITPDAYYTFGIMAYRIVDHDIWNSALFANKSTGDVLIGSLATATPNPYQPSSSVSFGGNVTGTVAGVPGDSISKTPATVVVADGSTSHNSKRADFVVPVVATNADVTIAQAISALPSTGGRVILLDGTFTTANTVNVPSNVTIEGQGNATIVRYSGAVTGGSVITSSGTSNASILSMTVDANNAATNSVYVYNATNIDVANITAINAKNGSGIDIAQSSNVSVTKCNCSNSDVGISLYGTTNCKVVSNITHNNIQHGFALEDNFAANTSAYGNTITGNNFSNNTQLGIYLSISGQAGNQVRDNTITGNTCNSNGSDGIWLNQSVRNTINGNTSSNNGGNGIYVDSANQTTISGNNVQQNSKNGIFVYGSNDNNISGNVFASNSQASSGTYANINISYNSSTNNIQTNTCRRGTLTNQPNYGISIVDSSCSGNVVTNNDLITGGATGAISDAGTGTVTAAGNRVA